jgi:hypothetical protein
VQKNRKRTAAPFLRSFCGPQCREQPGTDENGAPRSPSIFADIPACSRLFPVLKFIGETGFEPATARPPAGSHPSS